MTERDQEVERICHAALDCPPESRASLIAAECGGDEALRREVERLLAFEASADQFLETHALRVPSQLGPYEIRALLGVGGMGEVYRARDTVLERDVAVKVLPRLLADDSERLARLQREAKVLASLNHANIAHVYGVEQGALVMELVDGETLRAPLPMRSALGYACQIAAALEAAHEKGIVHRDLKLTNIMTTRDGTVKVLDFGLAAIGHDPDSRTTGSGTDVKGSATTAMTRSGAIMGTAAYMSPEQASGAPVDKRTDIWSFGAVLWQLLTGRALFEGETTADTLSKVKTEAIDLRRLPGETPDAIRDLLARCLDRDPKTRLRDIGEARIRIQRLLTAAPEPAPSLWRTRVARAAAWIGAGLAVVFALLFTIERQRARRLEPARLLTFQVNAPPLTTVASGPAISPDGRWVAFTASGPDDRVRIWVHALDTAKARVLGGTEDAFSPLFWSPDSRFVGFATPTKLSKVDVAGGPPVPLCDRCGPSSIGSRVFRGGAWSAAGVIVYAISSNGLWRVPDTGGEPIRVTPAGAYGYPAFLPDGVHVLYTWFGTDPQPGVYVGDLRQNEPRPSRRLIDGGFVVGSYVPGARADQGYLLSLREGMLSARLFNPTTTTASGEPVMLAEEVPALDPPAAFSASSTGSLAFTASTSADRSRLVWIDRSGKELGALGQTSYGSNVSISPNGRQIVFDSIESDRRTRRIWTADPVRGVVTLVATAPVSWIPATSNTGDVAYAAARTLFLTRPSADGSGDAVYRSPNGGLPNGWSPDGRFLIFNELHPTRRADLYVLSIERRQAIPLVVTDADEWPAALSPDGKWIAFSSDETGTREVYVRDFAPGRVPAVGTVKLRVSTSGGDKPRWHRDGTELYYISPDRRLMAVPVTKTPQFSVGHPVALFATRLSRTAFPYDVAADGRFLMNTLDRPSPDAASGMTVVLNWASR
jgi:eukaryotic-like serine/threonine-protein kinase